MEPISLTLVSDAVLGRRVLEDGGELLFHAKHVRKERTGVHATVSIGYRTVVLAADSFNIERLSDRARLARYVHERMTDGWKAAYPLEALAHDLDYFCSRVWPVYAASIMGKERGGSLQREPVDWLVRPWIVRGGGTIIFGPPGAGKSFTAQSMAVSLDAGDDAVWEVQRPARVLYVNLERSVREMDRRLGDINNALGFGRDRPLLRLDRRGWSVEAVADAVRETVRQYEVECIVWDSLSRAGTGGLVKDEAANKAMDLFNSLSDSWLALAHTPRASDEHVFGSMMFDAAADIVVRLTTVRRDDGLGVGLQVVKANDVGPVPMRAYAYTFDQDGLVGMRQARLEEFPLLKAGRVLPTDERVQDYLLDHGASSASEIAEALGVSRSLVASILNADSRFVQVERRGREVLYGVREG